ALAEISDNNGTLIGTIINPSCTGGSNGSITTQLVGGTAPFDYDWSNGENTQDINNLPEGNYLVTVTDVNFCSWVDSFELIDPDSLLYEVTDLGIVTCEMGSDGFIGIAANGGIPPYTYLWSSGQSTPFIDNLVMGDYTFTITDNNGCTLSDVIPLNENSGIQLDSTVQQISCFGFNDGAIIIQEVIGGVPPYTINFFSSDTSIVRNVFPEDGTQFTNLGPDDYTMLVEDSQGCSETFTVTLIEPFELTLTLPADTTINSGDRVPLNPIFNRPIQEITFDWTPDDFLDPPESLNTEARPGESTAYRLTIADLNGCEASDVIRIEVITRRDVDLPNAFSPNDDGLNDIFYVRSNFPESVNTIRTFRIFDRWGELVFERQNFDPNSRENGWDGTFKGTKLTPGVFVYMVEVEYYLGETTLLRGDVMLMR
ncbi:MAG: gliding motility-associated C-terminal domain-containing protein, partial [Bacteroidota bacterium]